MNLASPTRWMALCAVIPSLHAAALENWPFDEAADTPLSGLTNVAGSASWAGDVPNVVTDGAGNLVFSVSVDDPGTEGSDESTSNIFRTTDLTSSVTSGKLELAFTYTSAELSGGDSTGANVGFTLRDDTGAGDVDLLNVRLQKQNDTIRLQRRDANTGINTDLEDFGVTTLAGPLAVRVIVDLDSDTFDVFWTPDGQPERCQTNIPTDLPNLDVDRIRMFGNTNATDFGATDEVAVAFLSLSTYTDPVTPPAIEDWQFNIDGQSLGNVQNDAGTADLGGNADNVSTSGGDLVFTQGIDGSDNVFRNGTLTNPDQSGGVFSMEWYVSSATLAGGDLTGANVGIGMRELDTNTDLFLVRLQRQAGTVRLQTRVGSSNTNLVDFGGTTVDDLWVQVVADLDADTFSVYWQLGDGIGSCATGIAMAANDLEFDAVRVAANTNSTNWGATDEVAIDYLVVRDLSAAPAELDLSIVSGPGADEVTLVWPTSTPATAVLQESTDLGITDAWAEVLDTPTVNGDNYELTVTTGTRNFYRLNTEP